MKRINVVGSSGSGKSTFSRQLAEVLACPYLEMDAMFWKANWQESSDEEFYAKLENALNHEAWVLDGNYNRSIPIKWAKVDTVIWIDYSLSRTIYQAIKRALYRSITKQELWANTGNVETVRKSFFSKDSMILWTLTNYQKIRSRYLNVFADPQYQHINFIRISSPKMAKAYLKNIAKNNP